MQNEIDAYKGLIQETLRSIAISLREIPENSWETSAETLPIPSPAYLTSRIISEIDLFATAVSSLENSHTLTYQILSSIDVISSKTDCLVNFERRHQRLNDIFATQDFHNLDQIVARTIGNALTVRALFLHTIEILINYQSKLALLNLDYFLPSLSPNDFYNQMKNTPLDVER